MDVRLAGRGGFIDQTRTGRGAAHAILLVKFQVREFEHQFFQRLGLWLRSGGAVRRQPHSERDENRVDGGFHSAGATPDCDVEWLPLEELFEHPQLVPSSDSAMTGNSSRPRRCCTSRPRRSSLPTQRDWSDAGLTTTANAPACSMDFAMSGSSSPPGSNSRESIHALTP